MSTRTTSGRPQHDYNCHRTDVTSALIPIYKAPFRPCIPIFIISTLSSLTNRQFIARAVSVLRPEYQYIIVVFVYARQLYTAQMNNNKTNIWRTRTVLEPENEIIV